MQSFRTKKSHELWFVCNTVIRNSSHDTDKCCSKFSRTVCRQNLVSTIWDVSSLHDVTLFLHMSRKNMTLPVASCFANVLSVQMSRRQKIDHFQIHDDMRDLYIQNSHWQIQCTSNRKLTPFEGTTQITWPISHEPRHICDIIWSCHIYQRPSSTLSIEVVTCLVVHFSGKM